MAESMTNVLDFSRPVDYANFCHQIELILTDRNLMLRAAFDAYDSNNDDKISELDIFKILYQFQASQDERSFSEIFLRDIIQMSKILKKNWNKKFKQIIT